MESIPQQQAQPPTARTRIGTHWILDAWDCPAALLDDAGTLEALLRAAVAAGGATLIDLCVHRFSPIGVTATATLAESHIALHTWPERGYCAADLFFCGTGHPRRALERLCGGLRAGGHEIRQIERGLPPRRGEPDPSA